MDQTARLTLFATAHAKALATIQDLSQNAEDDVRALIHWLMTTEANPYGFLPKGWAGALKDAVGFAALCHHIDHALVDDGDITFSVADRRVEMDGGKTLVIAGEPRITFLDRWADDFEERMLTADELSAKRQGHRGWPVYYDIVFLDGVAGFIAAHARYEAERLRRCFLLDACHDLDQALQRHQHKPLFQAAWIDEADAIARAKSTP